MHTTETAIICDLSTLTAPLNADPLDDRGLPGTQHVRVRVRRVAAVPDDQGQLFDPLEDLDPSNAPGYPQDPEEQEAWLVANAARAIHCVMAK